MKDTRTLIEHFEEQKALRKGLSHDERHQGAALEFREWRELNPGFSTRNLLEAWRKIRLAWGLTRAEATDPPEKPSAKKSPQRRRSDLGKG